MGLIFVFILVAIYIIYCFKDDIFNKDDSLDSLINERIQKNKENKGIRKTEQTKYYKSISYYQLAKNPYYYEGERITFNGKVLQVIREESYTFIRFSINDTQREYNNNMVMLSIPNNIINERILEDEFLTIKGIGNGLFTYETIWNVEKTVPIVIVEEVSRKFSDFFKALFN